MVKVGGFEMAKLETRDGGHVGWTLIPDFRPCADVINWGQRFFHFRDTLRSHLVYRECFVFSVNVDSVTDKLPEVSA